MLLERLESTTLCHPKIPSKINVKGSIADFQIFDLCDLQ